MSGVVARGKRKDLLYFDLWVDGVRYHFNVKEFILPRLKPGQEPSGNRRDVERVWLGELVATIKRGENPRKRPPAAPGDDDGLDVAGFLDRFETAHYGATKPRSMASIRSRLKALRAGLGHLPLAVLNRSDDIKAFLVTYGVGRSVTSVNRLAEILRTAINWGIAQNPPLLMTSPFGRFGIRTRKEEEVQRARRLLPGEEQRLLANASGLMQDRIIGALETCCRQGEMLKIQNRHIDTDRCQILIPAANAKSRKPRKIPYEPGGRLDHLLQRRAALGPLAFVFGTDSGHQQLQIVKAWASIRLKANGVKPEWVTTKKGSKLSKANRQVLAEIDLTWHDLRHEGASRLLQDGLEPFRIQQMLGHSDIKTTQRYLNITDAELQASMRPFWEQRRARATLKAVK